MLRLNNNNIWFDRFGIIPGAIFVIIYDKLFEADKWVI